MPGSPPRLPSGQGRRLRRGSRTLLLQFKKALAKTVYLPFCTALIITLPTAVNASKRGGMPTARRCRARHVLGRLRASPALLAIGKVMIKAFCTQVREPGPPMFRRGRSCAVEDGGGRSFSHRPLFQRRWPFCPSIELRVGRSFRIGQQIACNFGICSYIEGVVRGLCLSQRR